jgi:hypothetical protein
MKNFLLPVAAALFFGGCESMPDRVRERFDEVPPQVHVYDAPPRDVATVAQQAFRRLDFRVTRANATQIEAASRIHSSEAFADSRQMLARVHLADAGPGKTEVELSLTEQVESQSFGGTRQETLKDNGFFALYFATLQELLQEKAGGTPAEK